HLVVNRLALKQKKPAIYQLIQSLQQVRPQEA
ncbi:MAG: ATP phosphoribosyltransferase, partial [Lacticaseibacillus rhamnosus]